MLGLHLVGFRQTHDIWLLLLGTFSIDMLSAQLNGTVGLLCGGKWCVHKDWKLTQFASTSRL